jgi:hypothetical protein
MRSTAPTNKKMYAAQHAKKGMNAVHACAKRWGHPTGGNTAVYSNLICNFLIPI